MTFEIFVLISEETRNKQKRCVSNFLRSIDQEDLYSGNCLSWCYRAWSESGKVLRLVSWEQVKHWDKHWSQTWEMPKYSKFLNKENKNTITYLLDRHKHAAAKTKTEKERNRNPLNEKAMNGKSQFVALLVLGWSIADCACLVISHKSYGHLSPYFLLPPSIWFLLQYVLL